MNRRVFVVFALWLTGASALPPPPPPDATLRLEYRLVPPQAGDRLEISWATRTASGHLLRALSAEDVATIAGFGLAVSTQGAEWRELSRRAANLLLDGIAPFDGVHHLVVAAAGAPLLRAIPFEALGSPPLIERFTVSYEPAPSAPARFIADSPDRLWHVPDEISSAFLRRYRQERVAGLTEAAALRRVKVEWLHSSSSGDPRSHPFYWASFVASEEEANLRSTIARPWLTLAALVLALVLAGAAFRVWWRGSGLELW